jgi:hypothetical protein
MENGAFSVIHVLSMCDCTQCANVVQNFSRFSLKIFSSRQSPSKFRTARKLTFITPC